MYATRTNSARTAAAALKQPPSFSASNARSSNTRTAEGATNAKKNVNDPRLPVTLLSGFLGSGKTTLLKRILEEKHDWRCAVIVNDMAELNVDAGLIKKGALIQAESKMIEMQNGCICCTLREDLLREVARLAEMEKFDYLVIESTGISEPMQVAETFEFTLQDSDEHANGHAAALDNEIKADALPILKELARLDTCVTVVDASNLIANMRSMKTLKEAAIEEVTEEDDQNVVTLLTDQLEFANTILLNKVDLVPRRKLKELIALVKALNPTATVIPTTRCQINLQEVINTGRFNFEDAQAVKGWMTSVGKPIVPESEEYGITSFVYRASVPFHPVRLYKFITSHFALQETWIADGEASDDSSVEEELTSDSGTLGSNDGEESDEEMQDCWLDEAEVAKRQQAMEKQFGQILRSKGVAWVGTRPESMGEWSQAGALLSFGFGGPWMIAVPETHWPEDEVENIKAQVQGPNGDRRQELVFIGISVKQPALTRALNACLCTDKELGQLPMMEDPFAPWPALQFVEDGAEDTAA